MPINSKSNVFQVPKRRMRKTRQPKTNWQSGSLLTMTAERQLKGEMYEITSIVMSHHWNCFIQPQVSRSHTSRRRRKGKKNYQCFLFLFLRGFRRSALPRYEERWRTRAPGFKFGHWSEIRKEPASIRWTLIIFFNVRSHFQCLCIFVGHPFQFFFFFSDRSTHSNLILKSWFQSRNSWGEKIKTKY